MNIFDKLINKLKADVEIETTKEQAQILNEAQQQNALLSQAYAKAAQVTAQLQNQFGQSQNVSNGLAGSYILGSYRSHYNQATGYPFYGIEQQEEDALNFLKEKEKSSEKDMLVSVLKSKMFHETQHS